MTPPRVLTLPSVEPAHFARNFIKQAVCELRFPTLFELESVRPPTGFAQALRKEYPIYAGLNDFNVGPGGVAQAQAHTFKSKRSNWTVTLRASAISLSTSNYDSFEGFEERLAFLVTAAAKVIDSDFFTRVGLRYINSIPFGAADIHEWVNPALVGVLGSGIYGDVQEHSQRVIGITAFGGYSFQHGLGLAVGGKQQEYVLDFDFFCEDVAVNETIEVARKLHEQEFAMFNWALGERSREQLGPSDLLNRER